MIVRSIAPLRLGFAGGGTDVSPYAERYGGFVLNATIALYARCTLQLNASDKVRFRALDMQETFTADAEENFALNGEMILVKAVYNRIVRDFNNGKPLPVEVTTFSDAPPGSGLGSSSTMVVAVLQAFREYLRLPLGEYEIATLAYEIERKDAGLAGGRQDQYAATFGGFNFMEFNGGDRVIVNPLRIRRDIEEELTARLLLYYTGRSRDSAAIIREQTDSVIAEHNAALEAAHQAKRDALAMKEYLLRSDYDGFAAKLGEAWVNKKKMAKSISNPRIDAIYGAAREAGACAGKVSGAGGGGFMMFAIDPVRRLDVSHALSQFGGSVVDFRFASDGAWSWRA